MGMGSVLEKTFFAPKGSFSNKFENFCCCQVKVKQMRKCLETSLEVTLVSLCVIVMDKGITGGKGVALSCNKM